MSQMPWMDQAWQRLGQAEVAGPDRHNEEIVRWWAIIGLPGIKDDETANCAAFGLAMLKLGGVSIDSMPLKDRGAAIAFETFGAPCDMREGAIVVTRRKDRNPRARHMGFLLSWTADTVTLLNANVGDKVCTTTFPRDQVTAIRWPEYIEAEVLPDAGTKSVPEVSVATDKAASPIPRLNHPVWKLLAISRTIRGSLWSLFGGVILFFQDMLEFMLEAAAKVQEMGPIKATLAEVGANVPNIGFAFVVWGVVWVGLAKLSPKPRPEPQPSEVKP